MSSDEADQTESIIEIANPTYDLTFKALFSHDGPVAERCGPRERLLSFIQELFPKDQITYIDYIETINSNKFKTIIFDVACKCFDTNGNFVYDVEIQRSLTSDFPGRILFYAATLLYTETKKIYEVKGKSIKDDSYKLLPKVRVISILTKNINEKEQAIFNVNFMSENTHTIMSDQITLTYIQLPKIFKEGTNSSWLQILSSGVINSSKISINKTQFTKTAYISALDLLEKYTKDKEYEALLKAISEEIQESISENSIVEKVRSDTEEKYFIAYQIEKNHTELYNIVSCIRDDHHSIEATARRLFLPVAYVDFIASISCFYFDYCQSNPKGRKEFLKQLRNLLDIPAGIEEQDDEEEEEEINT